MYIIWEYAAYVVMVVVLSALLFGATAIIVVTQAGARRLTETSRKVASNAIHLVSGRLEASRLLKHGASQGST